MEILYAKIESVTSEDENAPAANLLNYQKKREWTTGQIGLSGQSVSPLFHFLSGLTLLKDYFQNFVLEISFRGVCRNNVWRAFKNCISRYWEFRKRFCESRSWPQK